MSASNTLSIDPLNHYRRFVSDNIFIILGHIFIYGRGLILIPVLVKNIGSSLYGGYVLLFTGLGFISAISTLGVGFNFKRFMPSAVSVSEKRELVYPQFIFQLISIAVVCLLLIIFSGSIKTAFFKNQIDFSMWLVDLILIATVVYSVSGNYFIYTQKTKNFTLAVTSQSCIMVLFIVTAMFIFHKQSINMLLLAELCALIVVSIPLFLKMYKEIGFCFLIPRKDYIIKDISLGFPLILLYVADFILNGSDKFIIAFLLSAKEVGYYSPAYALGSLIILIPRVISGGVLLPFLSKAADSGQHSTAATLIRYTIKLFFLIAIPFICGIAVLSKPLLEFFANRESANAAFLVTPIVALGSLFFGLNLILSNIMFVRLRTKAIFAINAFSAILNLVLNIIFVYLFRNIVVAAITTFISYFLAFTILNTKLRNELSVIYDGPFILKSIISAVLMSIGMSYVIFILGSQACGFILSLFAGIAAYIISLFALKAFSEKELRFCSDYIKEVIKR